MIKRRDLTIIPMGRQNIVIACDSCGGVGIKDGDILKLPPKYAAKFAARVALTEVMCSGALPVAIVNGVSNEMNPTAAEMLLAIQEELESAGFSNVAVTGSTEENFPTCMTAVAATVIGIGENLKFEPAKDGDCLVLLGTPKVGAEVDIDSDGFYKEISQLLAMPGVREIVPVGSKGIKYEAEILAALSGKNITLYETGIDYEKSAGPGTCMLVLCNKTAAEAVLSIGCAVSLGMVL